VTGLIPEAVGSIPRLLVCLADSGTAFASYTTKVRGSLFRRRAVAARGPIYLVDMTLRHGIASVAWPDLHSWAYGTGHCAWRKSPLGGIHCQVTESPCLYILFRTAVPGIKPATRLPFVGLCRGWVVRSLSPHINACAKAINTLISILSGKYQLLRKVNNFKI